MLLAIAGTLTLNVSDRTHFVYQLVTVIDASAFSAVCNTL